MEEGPKIRSVHGPNARLQNVEAANERNPSPLIPLPIGWGEGNRRQFIGFMPLVWSFDSPHVGCYESVGWTT